MVKNVLERKAETHVHEMHPEILPTIANLLKVSFPHPSDTLAPMWHWLALETAIFSTSQESDLLPPITGLTRMWTGGSVVSFESFVVSKPIRRVSSISSLRERNSDQAARLYVAVKHDFYQDNRLVVSEEQDLVYCDAADINLSAASVQEAVKLFRYVKSPFGNSGVHYDWRHVMDLDGKMGGVPHTPGTAIAMLREFHKLKPEPVIRSVGFAGVSPLARMEEFYLAPRVLRTELMAS
ncbi:hypothetical protein ACIP1G_04715 [Pseudomonas sp. NPDC089392]|uniref:hypothetical protein n=1 Tax=Pseudomonas sp. NPDC089392 TaxID=3364459 RepID=UPI00380CBC46